MPFLQPNQQRQTLKALMRPWYCFWFSFNQHNFPELPWSNLETPTGRLCTKRTNQLRCENPHCKPLVIGYWPRSLNGNATIQGDFALMTTGHGLQKQVITGLHVTQPTASNHSRLHSYQYGHLHSSHVPIKVNESLLALLLRWHWRKQHSF